MTIAIESNDGINVASPFSLLRNFMVLEIDESVKTNKLNTKVGAAKNLQSHLKPIRKIPETKNLAIELSGYSTVISHNLSKPLLKKLKSGGVDMFITFRNKVKDAIIQYLQDKTIQDYSMRS